jgi:hypothetical protein
MLEGKADQSICSATIRFNSSEVKGTMSDLCLGFGSEAVCFHTMPGRFARIVDGTIFKILIPLRRTKLYRHAGFEAVD